MKLETKFKKAMAIKNPNIKLAKLETICLQALPCSEIWNKAFKEASKLRAEGAKYW